MPTPFSFVIIVGAVCGLVMVVGSIYLLRVGAIRLSAAQQKNAMTVEFINQIKVTTRYPAIGLFLVGLLFVSVSAYFSRPEIEKLPIKGILHADDLSGVGGVNVEIFVPGPKIAPDQDGAVEYIYFHQSPPPNIRARVIPTGYSGRPGETTIKRHGSVWSFEYSLGQKIEEMPTENLNIEEAPELPPLHSSAGALY